MLTTHCSSRHPELSLTSWVSVAALVMDDKHCVISIALEPRNFKRVPNTLTSSYLTSQDMSSWHKQFLVMLVQFSVFRKYHSLAQQLTYCSHVSCYVQSSPHSYHESGWVGDKVTGQPDATGSWCWSIQFSFFKYSILLLFLLIF